MPATSHENAQKGTKTSEAQRLLRMRPVWGQKPSVANGDEDPRLRHATYPRTPKAFHTP
jgi:hypothetical protein